MARIKFVHIEVELEETGACVEIIRAALGGGIAPVMSSAPAPVEPPAALAKQDAKPKELSAPFPAPVKMKREAKRDKSSAAPRSPRSATGGGDTMGTRILDALKTRPMSSLELARFLKLETSQVYPAVSLLKGKKIVESRNDDAGDGTRRYFIVSK